MKRFIGLSLFFLFFVIVGIVLSFCIDKFYQPLPYKNNRFLICMTSYKRPIFLSGQILRFNNQTYQNFHISAAIKGVPEEWVNRTFLHEWQPLIDSGKLTIRFEDNKRQLNNFLDTVRHIDLSKYDYFCKVDDDDWYTPDYLESVNEWLNKEPNIVLSHSKNAIRLRNGEVEDKMVLFSENPTNLSGPTMCFSREVIQTLLVIEKNPAALEPRISQKRVIGMSTRNEDHLFDLVAQSIGKIQYRNLGDPKVIYGQQYSSVIRGGYK